MARIRTVVEESALLVVVQGRLGAADMRRLEEACAPALTTPQADLIVDVQHATVVDRVAQAHLNRIETRGAVIRRAFDTSHHRPHGGTHD